MAAAVGVEEKIRGLSADEVVASRAEHGENRLTRHKGRSFFQRFIQNLSDPVIKVLLCALAANLLFAFRNADWFETVGIAISVLTATIISTVSEYGSEAAYNRLFAETDNSVCRVRRAEGIIEMPVSEVVVGDIILISAGEGIAADGELISGEVGLDQSAMTGENREVKKTPIKKCKQKNSTYADPSDSHSVLRGCTVISGSGEMLVCAVGDSTYLGGISEEVQMETRESPLKLRLSRLAAQISRLGYAAAVLVASAYLINAFVFDSGFIPSVILMKLGDTGYLFSKAVGALTLGLTVVVVAVPEGLPMMIAVVLSANIKRMVKAGVLVRKPVGIEAAGSMNLLLTDKTGTLTEGKVTVGDIVIGDGTHMSVFSLARSGGELWKRFYCSAVLNTASAEGEEGAVGGNAADRAILNSVLECRKVNKPQAVEHVIAQQLFDSSKKYSVCLTSKRFVYIKGAPEMILPRITAYLSKDGTIKPFAGNNAMFFSSELSKMRRLGGRVLLIAFAGEGKPFGSLERGVINIPDSLVLISAVLLNDRVRREAPTAVKRLKNAGVHVIMITGDNAETATAIGEACGIGGEVIESGELARLTDARLGELLPKLGIIARALPSDKSRLVRVAQDLGLVVGMTGDGINDAPALKRADIGFSMGSGTQVAKDAGDIVLLNDDLDSVANSVLYGRNIFKSIRKFITLQLTMNLCAVGVSMIGPFIGVDAPVTVIQMLWINIIMDTLGGLAFAGEPALEQCMREKPKRRDEPILNRYMADQIVTLGIFTIILSLCFLKLPFFTSHFRQSHDDICMLTAFFAFFIFAGVFNCFNARTDRVRLFSGISKNPTFIVIMSAVLAIQIAFVYLGGSVLRTVPLTASELGFAFVCSLAVFPVEFIRKLFWRLRKSGAQRY